MALPVIIHVSGVVITSSPGPISRARTARCKASVPDPTPRANDAPIIEDIPNGNLESSSLFIYPLQGSDVEGDELTYSVSLDGGEATIVDNIFGLVSFLAADKSPVATAYLKLNYLHPIKIG